jgi:hypothetical protein
VQNLNLRRAIQAYGSADFTQTLAFTRQAMRERLTAPERARAYELLGFVFGATNQPDSSIAAFREMILLDPDRELGRVSGRINGYFQAALSQVLVVRQPRVDSTEFVAGQGFVPIRYIVTSSARVRTVAISGETTVLIDSSVTSGQVNLRWPAQLPDGRPVPPGDYTVQIEARGAGQSSFSAARRIRLAHGGVDTLPHHGLPGTTPARDGDPTHSQAGARVPLYGVTAERMALGGDLDVASGPLVAVGVGTLITGFVASLSRPAPQPATANLLYNQLLREQLGRRNTEIARENAARRQAVRITVTPLAAGAR